MKKLLLINPNQMDNPPVIPIGLEYLVSNIPRDQFQVDILDLCFSENPTQMIENQLESQKYDLIGFTIRNVDSGMYYNCEFFLESINRLIQFTKKYSIPIVLGGAGFSAAPEAILNYTKTDYGFVGAGECNFNEFLQLWVKNEINSKIFYGNYQSEINDEYCQRGNHFDYDKYVQNGGIIGFETHRGCSNQCPYCIERKTRVHFKSIPNIISEIKYLVESGINHFHLCDCEFNENLKFAEEFCESLEISKLIMKWTLYMKPSPINERLFEKLKKSNAYLITISIDSFEEIQTQNGYDYEILKEFIAWCKKYEIKLSIDALVGYPGESKESINKFFDFFKIHRPDSVGIGFYFRIYPNTPLQELIINSEEFKQNLSRKIREDDDFLEPIFYHSYNPSYYIELAKSDPIFKISGKESGVNYQNI